MESQNQMCGQLTKAIPKQLEILIPSHSDLTLYHLEELLQQNSC